MYNAFPILPKIEMKTDNYYTTQLGAGLGMIQETLLLLRLWEPGITPSQLAEQAVQTGLFSRTTARRTRNIVVEMFAPRFLADGGYVAKNLKYLYENNFSTDVIAQICYLQTARSQLIFGDFITDVYWPKYSSGVLVLTKDDALRFIRQALDNGKMRKCWADSIIKRVSGYLIGCCKDFGLVSNGRRECSIQRFSIRNDTALYLAYELHFSGLSDSAVINSPDWKLFGLDSQDVINLLKTLSNDRHILIQSSADLVQIFWKYKTIEECLNVLTQR